MKKVVFSIGVAVLLCFRVSLLVGQPSIEWQRCLGGTCQDEANSIIQTLDGGYIVAGNTNANDGDVSGNHQDTTCTTADFWIVKLSSTGNIQWKKCFGGKRWDMAKSIIQIYDSSYIIAGMTNSIDGDVTGNHGGWDAWIINVSASGNLIWKKCFGGTSDEEIYSIQMTNDSGYVFSGRTKSNDGDVSGNHGGWDSWIVKISAAGILQWQKCLGGSFDEKANSVAQTNDNGYILAGFTTSNDGDVSANHSYHSDYWLVKLDSTGNIQWEKCFGGSLHDRAYTIKQTKDSGYIVVGDAESNNGDITANHGAYDCWVLKLDTGGNIQWQKCYGGSGSEQGYSIDQTIDGGYIIAGRPGSSDGDLAGIIINGHYWILKLDSMGVIKWQKCIGGSYGEKATSIKQTSDAGYIISGYTASNDRDVTGWHAGYYNDPVWQVFVNYTDYWIVKLGTLTATITYNAPLSFCQGDSVTLYANTDSGYTYQWQINGTDIPGAVDSFLVVTQAGDYTVKVDSAGCTAISSPVTVTVNPLPLPTINGSNNVCEGSTNTYYTEGGMSNYLWNVSLGGTITAGQNSDTINVLWNISGAQTLVVNYTDSNGCTAASPTIFNVMVTPAPHVVIIAPNVNCGNLTGDVYCTTPGMLNYVWSVLPDGVIIAGNGTNCVTVTWNSTGTKSVSVSFLNQTGCATFTENFTVNVSSPPAVDFTIDASNDPLVNFTNITSGGQSYYWDFGDGDFSLIQNPSHSYMYNGTFTVTLIMTDSCGDTSSVSHDVTVVAVGITELNGKDEIKITPNPTSTALYCDIGFSCVSAHLTIHNILGSEIISKTFTGNKTQIDVSNLAKGLYLLKIESDEGVAVRRFVKE